MGTDHREPVDFSLLLASQIILIILTIPAFIPRPAKVIILAVLGRYFYRIGFTQTTGDFHSDYAFGSVLLSQYMLVLDFALLTPPEKLRDLPENDRARVAERSLNKRIIWALELFSNPRFIGWAHEPSHPPPRPSLPTQRSRFIFLRMFLATGCFLISGAANCFQAAYANKTTAGGLVTGASIHWRALLVLSFGWSSICILAGIHAIFSAIIVGCGFSSPERWPLLFGSPLQAWSIKRFWRRFWHQMIRRFVLRYTSFILGCFWPANYIGTTGHKLARLYIAFCISGIIHLGGEVMATGKLGFKSFTFFMLQPFGITIEIVVSYLWRRLQRDRSSRHKTAGTAALQKHQNGKSLPSAEEPISPAWIRCVGFIWVILWMVWTAAYMVDVSVSGFMPTQNEVQFSKV